MRVAIISDVHSNLVALEAVLRHAESSGRIEGVWCLGDTVGYGPQPRECIARLREAGAVMVAGNHDRAATGEIGTEDFNPDAATAARWTAGQLGEEERSFLDGLPEVAYGDASLPGTGPSGKAGTLQKGQDPSPSTSSGQALKAGASEAEFTLVHGTLRWPIWEYLYSYEAAAAHLQRQRSPFGLVGHTHVPMLVVEGEEFPFGCEMYYLEDGQVVPLRQGSGQALRQVGRGRKLVVNPGGVGQPRDGDPRAAYALYDTESATITVQRVEYDIAATQLLMEQARLPRWLIDRLAVGR